MGEAPHGSGIRTFGRFALDGDRGCLLVDGTEVPLRPKTFALLSYLAANPGRLVSKDELIRAVWRGAEVTDDVLVQGMGELRRALGDRGPGLIRTVPRRGYRFDAAVVPASSLAVPPAAPPSGAPAGPAPRRVRRPLLAAMLVLLAAAGAGAAWMLVGGFGTGEVHGVTRARPAIAVLPLANLDDPASQYFADGLTDDLIGALGRFSSLTVVSWGAVQPYRGAAANPGKVARELGVQYQIEGSVRQTKERVLVNAKLVDARGHVLWSDRFDEPRSSVFELQEKLIRQISAVLALQVADFEVQRVARTPPGNPQAYDYLLQARAVINQGRNGLAEARDLLKKATDLDPGYAAAESTRAVTYLISVGLNWAESPSSELAKAEAAALGALQLDPNDVLANVVLGHVYLLSGQHDRALERMKRALAINPNDSQALEGFGQTLIWQGQTDAGIEALETARRIRPRMQGPEFFALALGYYLKGRYRDVITLADSAPPPPEVIVDPTVDVLLLLAACHGQLGDRETAARLVRRAQAAGPPLDIRAFGTWLRSGKDLQHLRDGLLKAGLDPVWETPGP